MAGLYRLTTAAGSHGFVCLLQTTFSLRPNPGSPIGPSSCHATIACYCVLDSHAAQLRSDHLSCARTTCLCLRPRVRFRALATIARSLVIRPGRLPIIMQLQLCKWTLLLLPRLHSPESVCFCCPCHTRLRKQDQSNRRMLACSLEWSGILQKVANE